MKKRVAVSLVLTLIGLSILGIIGFQVFVGDGSGLDAESKAYMDETVPKILTSQRSDVFMQYVDRNPEKTMSEKEVARQVEIMKRLGRFEGYDGEVGQARVRISGLSRIVTAGYLTTVHFSHGPAEVTAYLVKQNGKWFIHDLHINSRFFYE
jgi:hypothetical protein